MVMCVNIIMSKGEALESRSPEIFKDKLRRSLVIMISTMAAVFDIID